MKNTILVFLTGIFSLFTPQYTTKSDEPIQEQQIIRIIPQPILSHQQETWLRALEWCESSGRRDAINPNDRDGTPSYFSFQFKPTTFRHYGEKYKILDSDLSREVLMEEMKNYDIQRAIVGNMILDSSIRWNQQFPACIKKIGNPPANIVK